MEFIAREKERKLLTSLFLSSKMQTILLYGRRRVGKSELIKNVLGTLDREAQGSNAKSIYYECKDTTLADNIESLCELLGECFDFPPPAFQNIEKLFTFIFEKAIGKNIILVIDEYQFLRSKSAGLDSILKFLIDKYRQTSSLKLLLCGSYIDIMRSISETENPLYGRIDKTLFLHPMDYYDSSLFYPRFSNSDKVCLYSVFGGIPYYNKFVNDKLSLKENIISLISGHDARFENEADIYLKSQIQKISNANQVLNTLALGISKFSDILSKSHVPSSSLLAETLEKLSRMEIITKRAPINDSCNKKKTKYSISDPLFMFYYRYIYRYSSQRGVLSDEKFFEKYIKDDFYSFYVPHFFEDIARQFLIYQNINDKSPYPFDTIGTFWYDDAKNKKNGEFDIVTSLDDRQYVFYEVKFRDKPLDDKGIESEIEQVQKTGFNPYRYGFFSKSGFALKNKNDNLILYTLDDLYKR